MPRVNNTVLGTSNFVKRVDLMLTVLITKKKTHGDTETLKDVGHIY